jgi:O-antigen/teichoic acid export membrane protein
VADRTDLRGAVAWVGVASAITGSLDAISNIACLWLWVSPAELGIATMASSLFPVLERLATLGLGAAAVHRSDRVALSSLLWLSLAATLAVLAATLAGAPWIGDAFGHPIVGDLACAYAVKLLIQTAYVVPESQLRRELRFGALSIVRALAAIADTGAKLGAAYLGAHGTPELRIWCFVIGPLAGVLVTAVGLQLCHPFRPALVFSPGAAREALRFGVQISAGELLYFAYTSADYVVIGRVFGEAAVGAYRLAYELVLDVVRLVSMVTAEVAFPAFARLGGDRAAAGEMLVRFTRQNLLAIAPILVVFAVAADDVLAVLYPPLGPAATTAARILCIVGALRAASFVLPPLLAGLGHPRDALVYHAVAALVLPGAFVGAALVFRSQGYLAVAWAWAAGYPCAFALVLRMALARAGVTLARYLRGLARVIAAALGATLAAAAIHAVLPVVPLWRGLATAAVTAAVYVVMIGALHARMTPQR